MQQQWLTFTVKLPVDVVLKGEVVKAFYSRIFISGEVLGHCLGCTLEFKM